MCTQVKKISDFTERLVKQLRAQTKALQVKVTADKGHQQNDELMHVSFLTVTSELLLQSFTLTLDKSVTCHQ